MVAKPELKFIVLKDVESVLSAKGTMILVALNLFCLGYCRLFCRPEAIFWVDGIVGKWFLQLKGVKVEKVPGVQLLEQAMSSGLIDEITIFGSCSDEFRDLCNKRRIKIVYERQLLDFDLNNFVLPKDAALAKVVIIALPSPKQELLAFEISQKCDDSKILCIGGAMNMVCNDKLTAPAWVNKMNLEWIFRLKTDTKRRLVRLFTSFVRALLNLRILRDCAVCPSFEGKKKR